MKRILLTLLLANLLWPLCAAESQMVNLVCLVRFADEDESVFTHSASFYDSLYNAPAPTDNSVLNYFSWVSYRQLSWKSFRFPQSNASSTVVASYQDVLKRGQLQKYDAATNPIGYTSATAAANLEHQLVGRVAAYVDALIPDSIRLDNFKSGTVDNLTIVMSGCSERTSSKGILWPHQDNILFSTYKIKGCRVPRYLVVFDAANGYKSGQPMEINTGVLCHEMMHVLGAYDLYTSSTDTSNPVGTWDLMSDNNVIPQGMTAYMRWAWGHWMDSIPQIRCDGDYQLRPVGSETSDQVAYLIRTSKAASEYFMLEYRRKEGTFESGIPASGLLCYRISSTASGNLGTDKEIYIFRQNATANYRNAVLSGDLGITEGNTDASPFKYRFSNGTQAPFQITQVSECGETLSFHISGLSSTGIEAPEAQEAVEELASTTYWLNGQRCSSPKQGLAVYRGKAVLIR